MFISLMKPGANIQTLTSSLYGIHLCFRTLFARFNGSIHIRTETDPVGDEIDHLKINVWDKSKYLDFKNKIQKYYLVKLL